MTIIHILANNVYSHSSVGLDFELFDQMDAEETFQLKPQDANERFKIRNETCKPFLNPDFIHITHTKADKYFAIWGCHQIRESKYDRGLWVLGAMKDANMTVENAHQMISEALTEMKLDNQTRIWENMIINVNKLTPSKKIDCSREIYRHQCRSNKWYQRQGVKFAIYLCIIFYLVVTGISACIYAYFKI